MISYKEHPETASYTWEYRGGCYGSGKIAVYEPATPGEEYRFDSVPIEIREALKDIKISDLVYWLIEQSILKGNAEGKY